MIEDHQVLSNHKNIKLFEFTHGLDVDSLIFKHEIRVQKEWCRALNENGNIDDVALAKITTQLTKIEQQMKDGSFNWKTEDEDIHMNIERVLTEHLGDLGRQSHLGRSRNDLIATSLRLFVADELYKIDTAVKNISMALVEKSLSWIETIVPGITHMQFGQPVRFSHILSSHAWVFLSDLQRIKNARTSCLSYMPLGSAALAGTHLGVDLKRLSTTLGFDEPAQNSYYAVADRDFILDSLNAFAMIASHISRLCEDLMFWSQSSLRIFKITPEWSTGSSIMPNKRNPDVLEISRAKTARIISQASEGLFLVKSVLPSYGSDFNELKRTFTSSHKELFRTLTVLERLIRSSDIDTRQAHDCLNVGHILATDIANRYSERGLTFREAYTKVQEQIENSDHSEQQIHENIDADITFLSSVESRSNSGGTSLSQVQKALKNLSLKIQKHQI